MSSSIYLQRLIKQLRQPFNDWFHSMFHPLSGQFSFCNTLVCYTKITSHISECPPLPRIAQIWDRGRERKRGRERETNQERIRDKPGWKKWGKGWDKWVEGKTKKKKRLFPCSVGIFMFICSHVHMSTCSYLEIISHGSLLITFMQKGS